MVSRYVRRELRQLTRVDLEAFFDALSVVYNTSSTDGQRLFGEKFRSIHDFAKVRTEAGASRDCNHFSRGAGVHTQHAALAYGLEVALQSVNPSVSLPYWDFVLDAAQLGKSWPTSDIFKATYFGASETDIISPRVMARVGSFSQVQNAYGMLRPSWNTDPSPVVRRFGVVDGSSASDRLLECAAFDTCFASSSLAEFSACLEHQVYDAIPGMVGDFSSQSSLLSSGESSSMLEMVFRHGLISCPSSCSVDTPTSECQCTAAAQLSYQDGLSAETASQASEFMDEELLVELTTMFQSVGGPSGKS